MIITTTEQVADSYITETLGLVRGNSVRARFIGNDILAGLRNIVGGSIPEYARLMADARDEATREMTQAAEQLGADAIVSVRYSTSAISSGAAEILAYGTAVKLTPNATTI